MDSTIKDKNKADYRLPTDGPHRFVKKEVSSEKEKNEQPPYVIAVKKKDPEEEGQKPVQATSKYDPKELKTKARLFLKNPNLNSDQRNVLEEILGPEDDAKPS